MEEVDRLEEDDVIVRVVTGCAGELGRRCGGMASCAVGLAAGGPGFMLLGCIFSGGRAGRDSLAGRGEGVG